MVSSALGKGQNGKTTREHLNKINLPKCADKKSPALGMDDHGSVPLEGGCWLIAEILKHKIRPEA